MPVIVYLSEAYLVAGRLEEARQRRAGARSRPPTPILPATRRAVCGSWARARHAWRTQRASPPTTTARPSRWPGTRMPPLQAHCHHGLGTLYATTGHRELAHLALVTPSTSIVPWT